MLIFDHLLLFDSHNSSLATTPQTYGMNPVEKEVVLAVMLAMAVCEVMGDGSVWSAQRGVACVACQQAPKVTLGAREDPIGVFAGLR